MGNMGGFRGSDDGTS